jgi:beta-aspartyl-peptidase (threonine type)
MSYLQQPLLGDAMKPSTHIFCFDARRHSLSGLLGLTFLMITCVHYISSSSHAKEPMPEKIEYAIAIHGGAGLKLDRLSEADKAERVEALTRILEIGRKILAEGGTALDAVEQSVRALEDEPLFNAGKGSIFNAAGAHELDASIMDGATRQCGGVAGVSTVKNPISLARLVMTETKHIILGFDGAEQFADEMKDRPQIERVPNSYFSTEARRKSWQEVVEKERQKQQTEPGKGTVGCVCLDKHGNLAAGTSTGGYVNKRLGRIGDTPIIGAGNYADNNTCAFSGTGVGEHFIRNSAAYRAAALMEYKGLSLEEAVAHVVHKVIPADGGGAIAVDRAGNIVMDMNTIAMPRAAANSAGWSEVKLGK